MKIKELEFRAIKLHEEIESFLVKNNSLKMDSPYEIDCGKTDMSYYMNILPSIFNMTLLELTKKMESFPTYNMFYDIMLIEKEYTEEVIGWLNSHILALIIAGYGEWNISEYLKYIGDYTYYENI